MNLFLYEFFASKMSVIKSFLSQINHVIGQIMVTWPPYKIDIGVQYYFPTFRLRAVKVLICSILNLNFWKGTQQKWVETKNSDEYGLLD